MRAEREEDRGIPSLGLRRTRRNEPPEPVESTPSEQMGKSIQEFQDKTAIRPDVLKRQVKLSKEAGRTAQELHNMTHQLTTARRNWTAPQLRDYLLRMQGRGRELQQTLLMRLPPRLQARHAEAQDKTSFWKNVGVNQGENGQIMLFLKSDMLKGQDMWKAQVISLRKKGQLGRLNDKDMEAIRKYMHGPNDRRNIASVRSALHENEQFDPASYYVTKRNVVLRPANVSPLRKPPIAQTMRMMTQIRRKKDEDKLARSKLKFINNFAEELREQRMRALRRGT